MIILPSDSTGCFIATIKYTYVISKELPFARLTYLKILRKSMLMNNSTTGIGSLRKLSLQTVATDRTNISIGAPCHRDYRGAVIDYSKVENVRKSREQVSSRWSLKSGEKLTVGDIAIDARGIYAQDYRSLLLEDCFRFYHSTLFQRGRYKFELW